MITVSGQLIDQLRAMKDLMSSLLKNVSGFIMNCPENNNPFCYLLPWRERARVRGQTRHVHPHLHPPPPRGRMMIGVFFVRGWRRRHDTLPCRWVGNILSLVMAIIIHPSPTLSAKAPGLDQFNQKGRRSIFFT